MSILESAPRNRSSLSGDDYTATREEGMAFPGPLLDYVFDLLGGLFRDDLGEFDHVVGQVAVLFPDLVSSERARGPCTPPRALPPRREWVWSTLGGPLP